MPATLNVLAPVREKRDRDVVADLQLQVAGRVFVHQYRCVVESIEAAAREPDVEQFSALDASNAVTSLVAPSTLNMPKRTGDDASTVGVFATCSATVGLKPKPKPPPGATKYVAFTEPFACSFTDAFSDAPTIVAIVTSASPTVSADAVDDVRCGLRAALSRAEPSGRAHERPHRFTDHARDAPGDKRAEHRHAEENADGAQRQAREG